MNEFQRVVVAKELEAHITDYFKSFNKEVVFNTIMPTERRFRADYHIPSINCIIELNGGQWVNGRHNRGGSGYEEDLVKMNLANANSFFYLAYTYEMLARQEYLKDFENMKQHIRFF